jgi:deoxyadenosine/deoxycytidine kinase
MDLARARYLVVEGPIGVGKTSLARRLADYLQADLLLEAPQDNPFLAQFYRDMARYALPTQLNFLFQRVDQIRPLSQADLFKRATISDFLFDKDPLFAKLNLSDDEFALYEKIYSYLKPQTVTPDLVIYLQAKTETLVERVAKRGWSLEQGISESYLARLADAYSRYFYRYDEAPLLIVNSDSLNFVDNPAHLELLLGHIAAMRGRREFFNVAGA